MGEVMEVGGVPDPSFLTGVCSRLKEYARGCEAQFLALLALILHMHHVPRHLEDMERNILP